MTLKAEFPRMFRIFPSKGAQQVFCGPTIQVKPFVPQQHINNVAMHKEIVNIEGEKTNVKV
jgi:hypothetical protein